MKSKSKQLKRLWSLALLLMLMCLPEMAWAETGVWTYKGTHYGICAVNNNTSIQYIGMGNKSGWGDNSILYREDLGWGSKGTEFGGKTTKENEKFIAICYFSQDNTIPAYTKTCQNQHLLFGNGFKPLSAWSRSVYVRH